MMLALVACGGGGSTAPGDDDADATVASVSVTPGNATLAALGANLQFGAAVRNASGATLTGKSITWESSAPEIASVNPATGIATAVATGTTTITAKVGTVSGSATLVVSQVPSSIAVSPPTRTLLAAGLTQQYDAVVRDAGTSVVPGQSVTWTSSSTSVATIHPTTGLATAVAPGTTMITATAGTIQQTAMLTVKNGTMVGDRFLLTDFGNVDDNDYLVGDIFAVWWDRMADRSADAQVILNRLAGIRSEALAMGLQDPPNPDSGTYVNVYLHVPGAGNDNYPDAWGNGVGTDSNGLPFMSLPVGFHLDHSNTRHEGFHLFQYRRTSPGFAYAGDAAWYTEASANWFAAIGLPGDEVPFVTAATIPANPQLALWHAFNNAAPGDPANWNRQVRQYALNTWLHYLTTAGGQPTSVLVDGFNAGTQLSPQEYLASRVPALRSIFADWAAHSSAGMDYLSAAQWTRAQAELVTYGDATDINPFVAQLVDAGTAGTFFTPPADLLPRGWSYNVIRIVNSAAASYRLELDGSPTGSQGGAARFEARVIVRATGSDVIHLVPMTNNQDGAIDVSVAADVTEILLVVASVPAHFAGNQVYSYGVKVDRN